MKALLQATATLGIASALGIVLKMVGAKVVASVLGPSGVGIYAQLVLIADLGIVLSSMGLSTGIIRFASEFRSAENWEGLGNLEWTLILTQIPFSLLVGAAAAILSPEIARILLGQSGYDLAVLCVALGLPLATLAGLGENLTNAAKQFRFRAIAISADALAGLAFLAPLVIALGVLGAGISLAASNAFRASGAWLFALRLKPTPLAKCRLFPLSFDARLFTCVFQYGATTLASTSITYFTVLLVRTSITTQLGPSANGLYQVVWASHASWTAVMFSAFSSYFYPLYCEAPDSQSRYEQINRIIRFMVLITTPFLTIYMLFRSEVVLILYTPEFLPAVPLLGTSLLYGLFSVLAFCLNVPLLASGRVWMVLVLTLLQQSIFVTGSYILLPIFQLQGVVYSSGLAVFVSSLVSMVYARQQLRLQLSASNMKTIALSAGLVAAVFGLSELPKAVGFPVSLILSLAWAYQALDRSEMTAIRQLVYAQTQRLANHREKV